MKQQKGIKAWAEDDRPREKLQSKGRHVLSNAEILAIVLSSGSSDQSAVELAASILRDYDQRWTNLGRAGVAELCRYKGVGPAKAISVIAALELGRRRAAELEGSLSDVTIKGSRSAYEVMRAHLGDLDVEQFWILLLSRSNKLKHKVQISSGGLHGTVADVRMIFKSALEKLASSIILCHNHPSGNLQASEPDLALTRRLVAAGKLLEIPVLDHIIFTDRGYLSFADEGLI